jgi:hypothetical protein
VQRASGILNHMHPAALFAWHMVHNFLITHRAEWIAPEYIKLWLRGLPQVGAALPTRIIGTLTRMLIARGSYRALHSRQVSCRVVGRNTAACMMVSHTAACARELCSTGRTPTSSTTSRRSRHGALPRLSRNMQRYNRRATYDARTPVAQRSCIGQHKTAQWPAAVFAAAPRRTCRSRPRVPACNASPG